MSVSTNIRRLRKKAELTQEQLADMIGVARSTVTQWERGWSSPRMGMVEKIAGVFGVSTGDVVSDEAPGVSVYSDGEATVPLAIIGKVHAGDLTDEEEADGRVEVPSSLLRRHKNARALLVEGDCMNRRILPGEVAIYDPDMEPVNGSIVIAELEDYTAIMRMWLKGANTLMLVADSTEHYDDIVITDEHQVRVLGVVFWQQSYEEMG